MGIATSRSAIDQLQQLRDAARRTSAPGGATATAVAEFDQAAVTAITGLASNRSLADRLADLQSADLKPTASTVAAVDVVCTHADATLNRYRDFISKDLVTLDAALRSGGQSAIPMPATPPAHACGPGFVRVGR